MLIGQPKLLKEVNKDIVKDIIFDQGPITKPELSKKTNLSLPTVNKIVDDLEQDGIIRQDGISGSSSGKKAKLYTANENAGNIITLYYLDGKFKSSLVNAVGKKIYEELFEVETSSGEAALKSVYRIVDRLIALSEIKIRGIGIGVPGVVQSDKRITNISVIPGWTNLKLENILSEHYELPVFIENDVKLTTVGYYHTYLEGKCRDMVYLYIGRGIGSGVIINGNLHKGFNSFAGEFGYLAPFEEENKNYAQGGGWLEDRLQAFYEEKKEGESLSVQYVHYIAVSMIGYIVAINPEIIVLQGKDVNEETLEHIRESIRRYIPEESLPKIVVNEDEQCADNGLINFCLSNLVISRQLVLRKGI